MKKIVLLSLIYFFVLSCSNNSLIFQDEVMTPISDTQATGLIDIWNWVSTSGGFAGITETPSSEGVTRQMEILTNSIKFYENNMLISNSEYIVEIQKSFVFNEDREILVIEDNQRYVINLDGNKLLLIGDCADCFTMEFKRK